MHWQQYTDKITYIRTREEMKALFPDGKPMLYVLTGYIDADWDEQFNVVALPDDHLVFRSVSFCTHCGAVITHYYCDCEEAQSKLGMQRYGPEFKEMCDEVRRSRREPSTEKEFIEYMGLP